jgi:hypothetical protein
MHFGNRIIKSRFVDHDFTQKRKLLDACVYEHKANLGDVVYDELAVDPFYYMPDGTMTEFPSIHAWEIPNAVISNEFMVHDEHNIYVDGSIFVGARGLDGVEEIGAGFRDTLAAADGAPIVDIYADRQVLILHNEGGGTWGHFVIQNFPKALLFLKHYPDGVIAIPAGHMNVSFGGLFRVFGIPAERILGLQPGHSYRVGTAVLIDFMFAFGRQITHPAVVDLLAAVPDFAPGADVTAPGAMWSYVSRLPRMRTREVTNQSDVDRILDAREISKHVLGDRQIQEQIRVWQQSGVMIATIGSDLTNLIFARPETRLLVLSPNWFGDMFFFNLAAAKRLQWNDLRCGKLSNPRENSQNAGFAVDTQLFDGMLQRLGR